MSGEQGVHLHGFTLDYLAQLNRKLVDLLDDAERGEWYLTGVLVVNHRDGWTPGYFDLNEDSRSPVFIAKEEDLGS